MAMMKNYLSRCDLNILFMLLKKSEKELADFRLRMEQGENRHLKARCVELSASICVIQSVIERRLLENGISLMEVSKLVIKSCGALEEVYKEVLKFKIMEGNELVSLDLLEAAVRKLSPDQLVEIIYMGDQTIYGQIASARYDEMLFEVSDDIYAELESKMEMGRKEYLR